MSGLKNIIRKQTLQFHYNGNTDGIALQKEVSDWCNLTLIPEIEGQLEIYSLSDSYLSIDKLEIEATVESNDWKEKIRDELLFKIKEKLSHYNSINSEKNEIAIDEATKLDELIIYYFKTGRLPWWGRALLNDDIKAVLENWITEEKSLTRASFIHHQLTRIVTQKVAERIVYHVPEEFFFRFIRNIYKEYSETLIEYESFFEEKILSKISNVERKIVAQSIYMQLLQTIITSTGKIKFSSIFLSLYYELKALRVLPKIVKKQSIKIQGEANSVTRSWQEFLNNISEKELVKSMNEKVEIAGDSQLNYNENADNLINPEIVSENKEEIDAELHEGIYIENAGAVIFTPFIPTLFEKLGLVKNGQITNPDLAVLIIQYCVSGQKQNEEYELVLPKILCGLDIDFPVNIRMEIKKKQIKEVNVMLQSLIDYWSVLKGTSIEGLRESFFVRSGKISKPNDEWLLNVEQKAYDMLLERLPWSITMIKLPWMKALLRTEWI